MGFATLRVPRVIPQGAPRARRPLLAPRRAPVHRARALRAAASASPTAPVTFRVAHRVAFGQVVKVVGEPQELGAWNAKDAPALEWGEGDEWTATLDLPPGPHEFKVVVAAADGHSAAWEGGPNRRILVADHGGAADTVVCHWGVTAQEEAPPAPARARAQAGPPAPQELGKMTVGKMSVEGGPEGTGAGRRGVGKMTVESGLDEGAPPSLGKMSVDMGGGAEEGASAAAAMTPPPPPPPPPAAQEDPVKQALGNFLKAIGMSSSDEDDQGGGSGGGSATPGGRGPAPARALAALAAAGLLAAQPPAGAYPASPRFFRGPRQL